MESVLRDAARGVKMRNKHKCFLVAAPAVPNKMEIVPTRDPACKVVTHIPCDFLGP